MFAGNRFRIRRDHILDDAYNQMSALSEDDLRGPVISLSCQILVFKQLLVQNAKCKMQIFFPVSL